MIECMPFVAIEFANLVARLCGGRSSCDQVEYLAAYLRNESLSVRTLVIEHHYVDRHFIEEYSSYYASCLRPPKHYATRIHAFALEFTREQLLAWVTDAASGASACDEIESKLQDAYRGFIVIRPLPSAPIGRTLLSTFTGEATRCFETLQRSTVHLLGFELIVDSVPFQQQDGAVGACATTAAWSALTAVARATGHRGPTPFQITSAANRHILTDRSLPAHGGLDQQQLLSAIRAHGFEPYVLRAANEFQAFSHSVKCYLASGMPVVLLLVEEDGAGGTAEHPLTTTAGHHALTAVGYRSPENDINCTFEVKETESTSLVTSGFARVYVHEDRLGPYARMEWLAPAEGCDTPRLRHLRFADSHYGYASKPMSIHSGIVPLYPKLRLTARELLIAAGEAMPLIRVNATDEMRRSLRVDVRFKLGGAYLRELLALGVEAPEVLTRFVAEVPLSRYVGVIRFSAAGAAIGDVVCDTTDMLRGRYDNILGCIPFVENYVRPFEDFTTKYLRRR